VGSMNEDADGDDPSPGGAPSVLLGRQPIVDRSGALVAYELLFRGGFDNAATVADDGVATATVAALSKPPLNSSS